MTLGAPDPKFTIPVPGRTDKTEWDPSHDPNRPLWLFVYDKIHSELSDLDIDRSDQKWIWQEVTREARRTLPLRRNMLNLRKKHIPRIKEIYNSVLQRYFTLE